MKMYDITETKLFDNVIIVSWNLAMKTVLCLCFIIISNTCLKHQSNNDVWNWQAFYFYLEIKCPWIDNLEIIFSIHIYWRLKYVICAKDLHNPWIIRILKICVSACCILTGKILLLFIFYLFFSCRFFSSYFLFVVIQWFLWFYALWRIYKLYNDFLYSFPSFFCFPTWNFHFFFQ